MQEQSTPDVSVAPQSVEEKIQSMQRSIARLRKGQFVSLCVMAVFLGLFILTRHLLMPATSIPGEPFAGLAVSIDAVGPYVIVLSGIFTVVFGQLFASALRSDIQRLQKATTSAI